MATTKPIRSVSKTITPMGSNLILLDDGISMGKAALDDSVAAVADGLISNAIDDLSLGTASQSDATDFATSSQGTKADSAVQPGDLSSVATSGDYDDLSGKPTLGTAAAADTTDFATASQGSLADTSLQPSDAPSDPDLSNDTDKLALRGLVLGKGANLSDLVDKDAAVEALNVKALNADGGFTFNLTAAPTQDIDTFFGGNWKTQHRVFANTSGTHSIDAGDGADTSRWAFSIIHNFDGSGGASGAPRLDGGLWVEAVKNGWNDAHAVGTGIKGPVTAFFLVAANNEWGDTAGPVVNVSKIYGDTLTTNTTGNALQYEGTTRIYDASDGATILRDVHVILGYDMNPTFAAANALAPGKNIGVYVEPNVGNTWAGLALVGGGSVGGGDFTYLLTHTTNRNAATLDFAITGPQHPSGGGLIRAGSGAAATPSHSFMSDPGVGLYRVGAGTAGFSGKLQYDSLLYPGTSGRIVISVSTTTNLSSAANAINTTNKAQGVAVYNTTNQKVYVANAASATAGWYPSDGGAAIVPA